jgi:hypothetical protein
VRLALMAEWAFVNQIGLLNLMNPSLCVRCIVCFSPSIFWTGFGITFITMFLFLAPWHPLEGVD